MTDSASDARGEIPGTNLRTLDVSMKALMRLLDRRGSDSALVPADAALITATISAARAELQIASNALAGLPANLTTPGSEHVVAMTALIIRINGMLDDLDRAVSSLEG